MSDQPFSPPELKRYAAVLVALLQHLRRRQPLRAYETVRIRFDAPALPLAEETALALAEARLVPALRLLPSARLERALVTGTPKNRLGLPEAGEEEFLAHLGGTITILAPERPDAHSEWPADRLALWRRRRAALASPLRQKEAQGAYAWTLCAWPTRAMAEAAGLEWPACVSQVSRACFLDRPRPAQAWFVLMRRARAIAARLTRLGDSWLHVESARSDLRFRIGGERRWVGISGRNLPSFEIYVSPDWRTVSGTYQATLPSFQAGSRFQDVRLTFGQGRLVKVEAQGDEDTLRAILQLDRGASRLGEFALVDRRFSPIDHALGCTLYDENFGGPYGSMHIALGQSYANTFAGSDFQQKRTRLGFSASALHWDLVSTEDRRVSAVTAAGRQVIYENGEFKI